MANRYVIKFSKTGYVKYTSHLDLLRMFKRAFKKADLGLSYSQGFNPHPKMSFAQPLSLGYAGRSELIELETARPHQTAEILRAMQGQMPQGIEILACYELPAEVKSLAAAADSAAYRIWILTDKTEAVLREARCPVVLDADGLNVLEGAADALKARRAPTVLTPHDGEFRRLGGAVGPDRMASAAALAQTLGAVVLLKGHRTVVTDGTRGYENRTGNPGMATGGSGDVLAGLLVSLLGQGLPPLEAAACAAWVHGAAGDLCAGAWGQYGLTPSDMVEALPRFLK